MTKGIVLRGMRDGLPIGLGYFAVAFSLGMIARKAGLNELLGFAGSFFTRASAGEYGVYSLMAIGASYAEVIAMCMIANLRYLLMSTALTQKLSPKISLLKRTLLACCVTDEIFGISVAFRGKLIPSYTFSAALLSGLMWASGTAMGIFAGDILPSSLVSALSVALYGMFIAIIIPPCKKDYAVGYAVVFSFSLSWLCSVLPYFSNLSAGTRTILLTLAIAAIAAWLKPVKFKEDEYED